MENKRSFGNVYGMVIGFFSIIMLLAPKLIVLGFIALVVLIIYGMAKRKMYFKLNVISVLFISFYLLYFIYSAFSRHPDLANRYIENKLSFIIIPILFSFVSKEKINYHWGIIGFLGAVGILLIESYTTASFCFAQGGGKVCFLASQFSYQHHPTYASAFYILAISMLVFGWKKRLKGFQLYWIIPALMILLISTLLCLSLAGILFLFVLIAVFVLVMIYQKWGILTAVLSTILVPFLLYFAIISTPQVEGEWTGAKWYADQYLKSPDSFVQQRKYPMSGTEVRLVMWTVSVKVLKEFPLGVGTGNVDEVLTSHLNEMNQRELAKQELNPHNQYFQTGIEIGWLGILIIILIILFVTIKAIKFRNWILLIMISNLSFNMFFESMLQRQSGIVFYTFVLLLLIMLNFEKTLPNFDQKKVCCNLLMIKFKKLLLQK
jgi:O-antigen ligase